MTVEIGARVGHYDVLAKLGEGGPASARSASPRELWRGLVEGKDASQW